MASGAAPANTDPTSIGLTKLSRLIFGEETINNLVAKGKSVRDIWEISTPTTQCNNTIGKVKDSDKCWICGLSIIQSKKGFNPECEHILPIAQAVIFLSLYKTGNAKENEKLQSLEYAWAHSVCNQEKSDICTLVPKNDMDSGVSENAIKRILRKIYNSNRSPGFKNNLVSAYRTPEIFESKRVPIIKKKYEAITEVLNGGEHNRYRLCILAGVVSAQDPENIREDLQGILDPGRFTLQEAAAEELRKNLDKTVQDDIRTHLGIDTPNKVITLMKSLDIYDEVVRQFNESLKSFEFFESISKRTSAETIYEMFNYDIKTNEGKKEWIESIIQPMFNFIMNTYSHVFHEVSTKRHNTKMEYNSDLIHKITINILVDFLIIHISRYTQYICKNNIEAPRKYMDKLDEIIQAINSKDHPDGIMLYLKHKYDEMLIKEGEEGLLKFVRNIHTSKRTRSSLENAANNENTDNNVRAGVSNLLALNPKKRRSGGSYKNKRTTKTRRVRR